MNFSRKFLPTLALIFCVSYLGCEEKTTPPFLYKKIFNKSDIKRYSAANDFPASLERERSKLEEKLEEEEMKKFRIDHTRAIPNPNSLPIKEDAALYKRMVERSINYGANNVVGSSCIEEELIPGKLTGTWREMGGFQYGSIVNTAYDEVVDKIYLISSGGHLWWGNRDGTGYEPLNDKFRLTGQNDVFNVINVNGNTRIFALPRYAKNELHYSDDNGITWIPCSGVAVSGIYHTEPISLRRTTSGKLYYHVRSIGTGGADLQEIFYSSDNGLSFSKVLSTSDNADPIMIYTMDIWIPLGSETAYVFDNYNQQLHQLTNDSIVNTTAISGIPQNERLRLVGLEKAGGPILYLLDNYNALYKSVNSGATWTHFADNPQHQGLFNYWRSLSVDPVIEDKVFYGSAHTYIWDIPTNSWQDITTTVENGVLYYDISGKVHWDSESLKVFRTSNGTYFSLYGGHGGLEISYDSWTNSSFLGRNQLAISTYYAHETMADGTFFGGTQDRGAHFTDLGFDLSCSIDTMTFLQGSAGDMTEIYLTENRSVAWRMGVGGFLTVDLESSSGKLHRNDRDFCEIHLGGLFQGQHYKGWDPAKYINHNQNRDYIFYGGGKC